MSANDRARQALAFVGWLTLSYGVAAVGAAASAQAGAFYGELARPAWAPPGWLFGPVWSVLYTLMAVAAWLVWRARGWRGAAWPLGIFLAQLAANAAWTWLFFAWRRGELAFIEILVLLALIAATMVAFWRIRPLAAVLLVPYLLWVSFASALAFALWRLNPGLLG